MSLSDIASAVGGQVVDARHKAVTVTGPVVIDSRQARPGSLFVALPGTRSDGHEHAADALAAEAAAVLAERPVPGPAVVVPDTRAALAALAGSHRRRLTECAVVGITGSAGKTTTKDLLAQILARRSPTVANRLSYNNEIGLPLTVLEASTATRYLVVEMGARARGEIAHLAALARPRVGVITNTGTAHLGPFGGRIGIRRAKAELLAALAADGAAVLNADDPATADMLRATRAGTVLTFGTRHADLLVTDVELDDLARPAFRLTIGGHSEPVCLSLTGAHQVANAAAAAAAAIALGLPLPEIAHGLTAARRLTPSRMQITRLPGGGLVLNDAFNANPDAMEAALATLAAIADGSRRAIAVLGEMRELGAESPALHQRLGRTAAEAGTGLVIAVGGADAARIAAGARRAGGKAVHVPTVDAVLAVLGEPGPLDVILVKGSRATGVEQIARALSTDT
ncbi:UDP-N-acetylmuramoyl-tripeptide--D-alanyl-D-alanine ligase [Streptomyces sp. M41]|uniref:UDP-N-acetylmuramoyl-tripeptide--D-alanyl-D- alanine ligase n=1 Tax=Streptomyces sp. M41 TaxID=3059412 RepID=UPI00374D1CD7